MPNEADIKILKICDTAEKQLLALEGEIDRVTAKLNKAEADPAKIEKTHKAVLKFLTNFSSITKLQGNKVFEQLEPATQARVIWLDSVFARLLKDADQLAWARKVSKLDFKKDPDKVGKELKLAQTKYSFPGIGTLVKQIEKGVATHNPGITFLPMAIILFIIAMGIRDLMKRKPSG